MKRIGTKFALTVGALAIAFSAFIFHETWSSTRGQVESAIAQNAELALEFDLAIREYVAESVRPEMAKRVGPDEFIPEAMSTSFTARRVFEKVCRKFPDYVLKFSSDNPRNPANVAGPTELKIIEYFRAHPESSRWVGRIEMDGKEYFAHFSPRRLKPSCLRCHGRPEDAPASLIARYGSQAGFHLSAGDVIATDTIAVPIDKVDAALAAQTTRQLTAMAIWLILLFGSILVVFRRLVARRLVAITDHFQRATEQSGHTPISPVEVSGNDEIAVLAASFNTLAAKQRALHESLEQRVGERTAELEIEIAERERAEERIRAARDEYLAITNLTGDVIVKTDREGRWTFLNESACRFFGKPCEQLIGAAFRDYLHPDDLGEALLFAERVAHGDRPVECIVNRQKTPNGWRTVEWNGTAIRDERGEYFGIQATGRDVTQRVEAERAIRQHAETLESLNRALAEANESAQAANRAKSEFLANMSHEIRTPMTAILGYTELSTDPNLSESERSGHLQTIRRNGEVLLNLLNDILDLSKIEAGKMTAEKTDVSPWQIVEEVVSLMRIRATGKGLALQAEYEFPIPQTIRTDPVRLKQVLLNLTGNAIKFTEQGSILVTVHCTMRPGCEPHMQFTVTDTGIGMTRQQVEKLFQPFTQGDASTARRFGGTGLGLTISKRLAEMLGGGIEVQSEHRKGSTFTVTIHPGSLDGVAMLDTPPEGLPVEKTRAEERPAHTLHGRVLLAEDGPDNQRLIRFILERAGLAVDLAENGGAACEMAFESQSAGRPYDLIVMDMQMPECDGYEATRHLRRAGWRGPIVALTAHAMTGDRQKCLQAGCDDYATKPIDRDGLLATVGCYLSGAGERDHISHATAEQV